MSEIYRGMGQAHTCSMCPMTGLVPTGCIAIWLTGHACCIYT